MRKLKIIEMYAGAGRSSAPFSQWRNTEVSLLVDWNQHACDTYLHNHPKAPYKVADLSDVTANQLRNWAGGKPDIILGCPPCQGFSESGKRDKKDPRNEHVITFVNLATQLKPSVIAMENVPLAGTSDQFKRATKILEQNGYSWTADILNAALYGSTQARRRLVMIAVRNSLKVDPALPIPTHLPLGQYFDYGQQELRMFDEVSAELLDMPAQGGLLGGRVFSTGKFALTPTVYDIIDGLPTIGRGDARRLGHLAWSHGPEILKAMEGVKEGGQRKGSKKKYYGAAYARLHRKGLARTITTYFPNAGSGRFWHPTQNRTLTLREAARIQGFPDSFHFLEGATAANATLVGNALDACLANATYLAVRRILD